MRCVVVLLLMLSVTVMAAEKQNENNVDDVPNEAAQLEHLRRADRGEPEDPPSSRDVRAVNRNRLRLDSSRLSGSASRGGGGGSVYTRWGRSVCPDDAELVYDGVAGGGYYNHQGSGSNLICLTREPEWANYTNALEGHARIYGAEYEAPKAIFSGENAPVKTANGLQDHDVPCAVCRVKYRSSMIMIPGRKSCAGKHWTREYWGYLATGHYNHKNQIQYVCVDRAPEADPKGAKNDNGALLYLVQGVCGSLPCPPYVQGRELTCVVCTK